MSVSLNVTAYSSKESPEFTKHYNAVKFCIENELSYPKETAEFFKGKVGGGDLDDYKNDFILNELKNGVEVYLPFIEDEDGYYRKTIKVSDIPKEADIIIVSIQ